MEHKRNKNGGRLISVVSRVISDGTLVELIYSSSEKRTALAIWKDGVASMIDSLNLDSEEKLVPVSARNNLIKHRAVLLPERPEAFESIAELVSGIQEYLYRYIDLSEEYLR